MEHLVEDHLRQPAAQRVSTGGTAATARGDALELDGLAALPDLLRDVLDLDERVRLDDAQQVLLEQRVVERGEVRADGRVRRELVLVVLERLLKVREVPVLVCARDRAHALDVS